MAKSSKECQKKESVNNSKETESAAQPCVETLNTSLNDKHITRDHDTYCGGSIASLLVDRLRRRAAWSYCYSGLAFLLIVGSIGWGLYVITTAGTITNLEEMQRINVQQADINNQIDSLSAVSAIASSLTSKLGGIEVRLNDLVENFESIEEISSGNEPPAGNELDPKEASWTAIGLYEEIENIVTNATRLNEPEITKVLGEGVSDVQSGLFASLPRSWPTLSGEFQALAASEKPYVGLVLVKQLKSFVMSLSSALWTVIADKSQQIQRLRASLENASMTSGTAFASQWISVIPSLLLRIGTIVLLLFLVKILVPIYQHNVRLAGFYQGRADALQILRNDPDEGLADLAKSMTPGEIHFGREPRTPTTEVLELAKRMGEIATDNATRPR